MHLYSGIERVGGGGQSEQICPLEHCPTNKCQGPTMCVERDTLRVTKIHVCMFGLILTSDVCWIVREHRAAVDMNNRRWGVYYTYQVSRKGIRSDATFPHAGTCDDVWSNAVYLKRYIQTGSREFEHIRTILNWCDRERRERRWDKMRTIDTKKRYSLRMERTRKALEGLLDHTGNKRDVYMGHMLDW